MSMLEIRSAAGVLVPSAVIAELNRERTPDLVSTGLSNMPKWLHVQAPIKAKQLP